MVRGKPTLTLAAAILLVAVATVAVAYLAAPARPGGKPDGGPRVDFSNRPADVQLAPVPLDHAIGQGMATARFFGDGISPLRARLRNLTDRPLQLEVQPGMVFESEDAQIVAVRGRMVSLAPGTETSSTVQTAATSGKALRGEAEFLLTGGRVSRLAAFIPFLQSRPEIPQPVIQTAVLTLTENLPLSAFAKFELLSGESAAVETDPVFKVETRYLVRALMLLQEMGYPMERLALTVDPQLRIEAMVDPLAHAHAMRYYGITTDMEWEFWKNHLLHGEEGTRHYALHGIAMYFPDIAIEMLPDWARREGVKDSYRQSALQSLALTNRVEALPILEQLEYELQYDEPLALASSSSSHILYQNLYHPERFQLPVPFRLTMPTVSDL